MQFFSLDGLDSQWVRFCVWFVLDCHIVVPFHENALIVQLLVIS